MTRTANRQHSRTPENPGHFLRKWRKFKGYTLLELEPIIGMKQAQLSRIERGEFEYTQELLEDLAPAFGCTPADLISRAPDKPPEPTP